MATMRKFAGLIAALLFVSFGGALLLARDLLLGFLFASIGIVATFWQARSLIRKREDPYDLSRLFDAPPADADVPEDDFTEDDDVPFCYHCGHAVARPFARCPQCGASVR